MIFEKYDLLKKNLYFHGLVTRETVASAMKESHFLLNIGNTTNYHLPSKSAEYLMSGKPIINICQNEEDTFQKFMQDYLLICNLHNGAANNSQTLNHFIQNNINKSVSTEIITQLIQPYTLESVANSYFKLLHKS